MIKAAFFDVDGTLLSHRTKQIPPSARKALDALKTSLNGNEKTVILSPDSQLAQILLGVGKSDS